jgi:voltage-gated potassium channel
MYAFEGPPAGANGLKNYADALWWTTMVRTTLGSEYWPKSPEGRLICLFLAIYAITVFGYMTAELASFFVDRDAADDDCEVAGQRAIVGLRDEIAKLREDVQALARHGRGPPEPAKRG